MNNTLRKHWTSLLGALFIITAFITLFKYTIDQGWVTDEIKIGIGLLVGIGLVIAGLSLSQKNNWQAVSEISAGLGVALLYTTCSFAGIYYDMWDPMTVFICMFVITVGIAYYSHRFNSRILMSIGLLGGLISPVVMLPSTDQVFTLFLYLFVINAAFFFISIRKNWLELRLVAFAGTWILYMVYFIHFDPDLHGVWSLPFRYASAAFLFYVLALFISSWKEKMKFDGLNLYLGIVNAVLFGLWSLIILHGIVAFSYPLFAMGLVYVAVSGVVFKLTGKLSLPVLTKLLGGVMLMLIAASQLGKGLEIKPLISVYVWTIIAAFFLAIGQRKHVEALKALSVFIWFAVGSYWYVVTWNTPRGDWFGVFIPFLNWGAISWAILAALGFYFSVRLSFRDIDKSGNDMLSTAFSILSHLIVGGLLTVQVKNIFLVYHVKNGISQGLTLSISWAIYALLLFLWGAYSKQQVFRIFGSIVLVMVAIKALFADLSGQDTIYKIIVFLILGIISFAISFINNKWQTKAELKQDHTPNDDVTQM